MNENEKIQEEEAQTTYERFKENAEYIISLAVLVFFLIYPEAWLILVVVTVPVIAAVRTYKDYKHHKKFMGNIERHNREKAMREQRENNE